MSCLIWAASSEFGTYRLCEQRRFRWACASAESRQNLRCSLIQAESQEEPSDRKQDPWPLWMAGHAQLKFVMTECWKTQIRLMRPISSLYSPLKHSDHLIGEERAGYLAFALHHGNISVWKWPRQSCTYKTTPDRRQSWTVGGNRWTWVNNSVRLIRYVDKTFFFSNRKKVLKVMMSIKGILNMFKDVPHEIWLLGFN